MAHATVGYCFDGTPENGGEGLLIGLNRCQAFKVAQRAYRGKGGTRVVRGDCLLTDCNVTGTDVGTPDKPKFALRTLWEFGLLPSLDALVATGGQCAGALVIHQEDNAGRVKTLTLPLYYYILTLPLYHLPEGHIRRAGSMVGSRSNLAREAGCLNCKLRKAPTQMSLTCRYSQPCLKDIQSYYKYSTIQRQTKIESGK